MQLNTEIKKVVIEDSNYILDAVNKIVSSSTAELDELMEKVHNLLRQDVSITDEQLSAMIMRLNTALYYLIGPNLGIDIKEEISKIKQKSDYALARQSSEGTVADRDNEAWLATQDITVLNLIYKESNKLMKQKIDRCSELLLSLKKIMSFRIQQMGGISEN